MVQINEITPGLVNRIDLNIYQKLTEEQHRWVELDTVVDLYVLMSNRIKTTVLRDANGLEGHRYCNEEGLYLPILTFIRAVKAIKRGSQYMGLTDLRAYLIKELKYEESFVKGTYPFSMFSGSFAELKGKGQQRVTYNLVLGTLINCDNRTADIQLLHSEQAHELQLLMVDVSIWLKEELANKPQNV